MTKRDATTLAAFSTAAGQWLALSDLTDLLGGREELIRAQNIIIGSRDSVASWIRSRGGQSRLVYLFVGSVIEGNDAAAEEHWRHLRAELFDCQNATPKAPGNDAQDDDPWVVVAIADCDWDKSTIAVHARDKAKPWIEHAGRRGKYRIRKSYLADYVRASELGKYLNAK